MTDDNRPMDPERLKRMRRLLAEGYIQNNRAWLTELLAGRDRLEGQLKRLRSDLDLYDRARLSDLRAQAERTCERRTAERDAFELEAIEAKRMVCITVVAGDPRGQREGQHALDCSSVETVAAEMGWPDLYPEGPDATEPDDGLL